ncbi:MAG: hypothetical protein ACK47Y_14060, partial [Dolichospermum sp.]
QQNQQTKQKKTQQQKHHTPKKTIKITENCYNLEKSQQDKLAADILQRSQELNLTHLKFVDSQ